MPISPVCVDASFVVALVTSEVHSERALARWAEWMREDVEVVTPMLLHYEVTSALRRKVVRGVMSSRDARRSLKEALSLDIELLDPSGLSLRAFDLAARLGQPATYDAHYLALAEMAGAELWSCDQKLYNTVHRDCAVRWVGGQEGHQPL